MEQYKCVVTGKTNDGQGKKAVDVVLDNGVMAHVRLYVTQDKKTYMNEDISPDGADKIRTALSTVFAQ